MSKADDKVRELAQFYSNLLVSDKRSDGKEFLKFKETNPVTDKSCRDLAFAVHDSGNMLPDDWRYQFLLEALDAIANSNDLEDIYLEADIYYHELYDWLGSHSYRSGYVDEAHEEYGTPRGDLNEQLAIGQSYEKNLVLAQVLQYLKNEVEETEAAESEIEANSGVA